MAINAKILHMATIEKPAYQWDAPEPLTQQSHAAPYPMDALPGIIGGAIREVVKIVKCPAALAANSALSVLATACQGVANVQPHLGLKPSPLILFLMGINDSGERKTTADNYFSDVLVKWCETKTEELEPDLKAYKAELASWNAQKRGLEKAIEGAASKGDPASLQKGQEAREKLIWLEQNEPARVYVPDMVMIKTTPESIPNDLKDFPSAAVLSNEGGAVLGGHAMKPENIANGMATFNMLWDGQALKGSTKGDGKYNLPGRRFSMGIGIQEEIIRGFYEKSGTTARGSGWFARFLLSKPDSTIGNRPITKEEAMAMQSAITPQLRKFHEKLHSVLEQQYANGKGGRFDNLPVLKLSDDALTHWVNYYNDVEIECKVGGDMEEMRDVASKSADNAARLAGLFHLFSGGDVLDPISGETMKAACKLAGWHLYEARRFFGEVALPKDDMEAVKLDAWLIAECKATGNNAVGKTSTLQRVTPASLRKVDKLNKALDTLERANRIRQTKEGKTAIIEVNPALLEGGK